MKTKARQNYTFLSDEYNDLANKLRPNTTPALMNQKLKIFNLLHGLIYMFYKDKTDPSDFLTVSIKAKKYGDHAIHSTMWGRSTYLIYTSLNLSILTLRNLHKHAYVPEEEVFLALTVLDRTHKQRTRYSRKNREFQLNMVSYEYYLYGIYSLQKT